MSTPHNVKFNPWEQKAVRPERASRDKPTPGIHTPGPATLDRQAKEQAQK